MSDFILAGLHRLEHAFKRQTPEKIQLLNEVLVSKRLSQAEMGDAVLGCIDNCKYFPTVKEIMAHARPAGVNLPPRDDHPVWDRPRRSQTEMVREERAKLMSLLDVYRKQRRSEHTLAAVEVDIQKLDREIASREQLAMETLGMSEEEAGAYAIEFWGGAKLLPNALAALRAGDNDRRMRGPETWTGQL